MSLEDAKKKQAEATAHPRRRVLGRPILAEGEDGLFTQSWYAVSPSSEVPAGKVVGVPFLNGRAVVFRGEDGVAQVTSAYCPHLGADLAVGDVVGNQLRCAYHHWAYDRQGVCTRTGTGEPPPPGARLFRFPTVERYGAIWAFNGEEPLFELPSLSYPDEELAQKLEPEQEVWNVDPWVACANTPDFHHFQAVHEMTLYDEDPTEHVEWTPYSFKYNLRGRLPDGAEVNSWISVVGTTLFCSEEIVNGRWTGRVWPYTMPAPGKTRMYHHAAVRKSEGDDASNAAMLDQMITQTKMFVMSDHPILKTAHYRPGTLTKSDRALAKFFDYVRNFPRANPAVEFLC